MEWKFSTFCLLLSAFEVLLVMNKEVLLVVNEKGKDLKQEKIITGWEGKPSEKKKLL